MLSCAKRFPLKCRFLQSSVAFILKAPKYIFIDWAVGITQWNHQRLPSCGRGFKSQAQHHGFFQFI